MRLPSIRNWLPCLALALLAACGGSDEGTTTTPAASTAQNVVAAGAITGFGSVYVNGVHFETSGATFSRDGEPARQSDLRVGQIVQVQGRIDDRGRATAESVRQHDNLEGPITAIDAAAQTFVVLAHTVRVTAETSFDDSLGTFATLTTGLQVEVSGMPDAAGDIVATRVEGRRAGETALKILGRVSSLDTGLMRFNIDQLVVNYSAATLRDFGPRALANGQFVEVKGPALNANGELAASIVELYEFEHRNGGSFSCELEGLVTRFVSATDFDIGGRPVTTTSATRYEGGTAADLALNVKVEAEGAFDAAGVLVATKVQFKRTSNAGVAGLVQSVNAAIDGPGGTLTVLGVTITVDNNSRIEDKSDARIEMFRLANLQVGDYVEVRGRESAPLQLAASRLERRRPRSEVWVRGTVRDLASPDFTALGVPVHTTGSTSFEDSSATSFFATAAGRIAKAKGTLVNNQVVAREVEFEDHDD